MAAHPDAMLALLQMSLQNLAMQTEEASIMRTRAALKLVNYDTLVKRGFITDWYARLPKSITGIRRYISPVRAKKDYSTFGMLMEYLIRMALIELKPETLSVIDTELISYQVSDLDLGAKLALAVRLANNFGGHQSYELDELMPHAEILYEMAKASVSQWREEYGTHIEMESELVEGQIAGHPDVIATHSVFDVKTSSSFGNMAKEAILQVLIYYVLGCKQGLPLKRAGFILPMQRVIICFKLEKWNYNPFWQHLCKAVKEHQDRSSLTGRQMVLRKGPIPLRLGSHVNRHDKQSMAEAICEAGLPACQMFLYGNTAMGASPAAKAAMEKEIPAIWQAIEDSGTYYFTHAPYSFNLARHEPHIRRVLKRSLRHELRVTTNVGGRGVVIHVGKAKELQPGDALDFKEILVRRCLKAATSDCPLLIETPVGAKSELCVSPQEMVDFFNRFSEEGKSKLGLCLDTCHVFAAGYWPMEYIEEYTRLGGIPIKLFHYNDSKLSLGSRRDRHASAGDGHIGMGELNRVLQWAADQGVPLVRE